jgi:hypothetical protein
VRKAWIRQAGCTIFDRRVAGNPRRTKVSGAVLGVVSGVRTMVVR